MGALTNTIDEVENHPSLLRSLSWGDRDYFATQLDPDMLRDLRSCLQTGTPLGNDRFRARIEQAPGGVKVGYSIRGRPKKPTIAPRLDADPVDPELWKGIRPL